MLTDHQQLARQQNPPSTWQLGLTASPPAQVGSAATACLAAIALCPPAIVLVVALGALPVQRLAAMVCALLAGEGGCFRHALSWAHVLLADGTLELDMLQAGQKKG